MQLTVEAYGWGVLKTRTNAVKNTSVGSFSQGAEPGPPQQNFNS